jgi:ribosomal protein L34E
MVHGANKSNSRKRKDVRTTTQTKRKFVEKTASKASSLNGKPLPGTVSGNKTEINKHAKTQRRPNRPFGGVMNSVEMRAYYKSQARLSSE